MRSQFRAVRALLIAFMLAAVAMVVAPAAGSADPAVTDDSRSSSVTIVENPKATDVTAASANSDISTKVAACVGPFVIDAFAAYIDCNVISTTTFLALCSDGVVIGGTLSIPPALPGLYRVIFDCFPASIVQIVVI